MQTYDKREERGEKIKRRQVQKVDHFLLPTHNTTQFLHDCKQRTNSPDSPLHQSAEESPGTRLMADAPHMLNLPCQFRLPVVDDRERTKDEERPTKSFTAAQVHQQRDGLEWFET